MDYAAHSKNIRVSEQLGTLGRQRIHVHVTGDKTQYSPVANMTHLVFVYKVVFLTVSKSLFSADSKSDCSQTQKVERFSKNR